MKNADNMTDMIMYNLDTDIGLFIGENKYFWEITDNNDCTIYDKEIDKADFIAGLKVCKNLIKEWFVDEEQKTILEDVKIYTDEIDHIIEKLS